MNAGERTQVTRFTIGDHRQAEGRERLGRRIAIDGEHVNLGRQARDDMRQ